MELDLKLRISADGRAAIAGLRQVETGMERMGTTAKSATATASDGMERMGTTARQVGMALAAYLTFDFLKDASKTLFDASAQLQSFDARFTALAGSMQAGAAEMAYVQEAANRLSLDLNTARESYSQFLALQQSGLVTQQEARDLMEGVAKASMMLGVSTDTVKSSITQMSQALSMGVVSWDAMQEAIGQIPTMTNRVATILSGDIAQMKKDLEDGKITSQAFAKAVIRAYQEAGQGAETMANTLGPTLTRVKNAWQLFLEELGKTSGAAGAAQAVLAQLETSLITLTAHSNVLVAAIGGALVAALTAGVLWMGRLVIGTISATAAVIAKAVANREAALTAVALAEADHAAALAAVEVATANVALGVGLNALATAQARAAESQAALIAAQEALAASSTALGVALRFLAGPGGLLLIGVAAFASLLTATKEQDSATQALTMTTDQYVESLKKMTAAQKEVEQIDLSRKIAEQTQKLADLKREMESIPLLETWGELLNPEAITPDFSESRVRLQAEYDRILQTIADLQERKQALLGAIQQGDNVAITKGIELLKQEQTVQQNSLKLLQELNASRQKELQSLVDEASAYANMTDAIADESTRRELAITLAQRQADLSRTHAQGLEQELFAHRQYLTVLKDQATQLSGPAKAAKEQEIAQTERLIAETEAALKAAQAKTAADEAAIAVAGEVIDSKIREREAVTSLTEAYLTGNPALIAEWEIKSRLAAQNPAQYLAAEREERARLNLEAAKGVAALMQNTELLSREMTARQQGQAALLAFNTTQAAETALRGVTNPKIAEAIQLRTEENETMRAAKDAIEDVMDAYEDSLPPAEKYAKALAEIARKEELLKKAGQYTEQAAQGIAQLRREAEQAYTRADPMAKAYVGAAEDIRREWTGMWEGLLSGNIDSFREFADALKGIFIKMLAQMAAMASSGILVPIVGLIGGLTGQSAAAMNVAGGLFGGGGAGAGALGGLNSLSGIGSLLGLTGGAYGGFAGGAALGGSLIANQGFFGGMGTAFSSAGAFAGAGSWMTAIGTVAPYLAAIAAIGYAIYKLTRKEPHPSSLATAGGFMESENGPEYPGKGGGKTGASGIVYGYDWGHTDAANAEELRDAFMEIDAALVQLIPDADLAGVKLGEYGYTAEGFVAATHGYVESMEEATGWFIKDWVQAAADLGAVSQTISGILQGMAGDAETVVKGLAGLLQAEDYLQADLASDVAKIREAAAKTGLEQLNDLRQTFIDLAHDFDGSAASAEKLGAASQALYQSELQMIQAIAAAAQELTAMFASTREEVATSIMDQGQKRDYYLDQARQAYQDLMDAVDPAAVADAAKEWNDNFSKFWGQLTEEERGQYYSTAMKDIAEVERMTREKMQAAQDDIVAQHQKTADIVADALETAAEKAAAALKEAAQAAESAAQSARQVVSEANSLIAGINQQSATNATVKMATGGFVPGPWNGQAGEAGDTVMTALTPGEAVIPRAVAQRHAPLIRALLRDEVRYAASGTVGSAAYDDMAAQLVWKYVNPYLSKAMAAAMGHDIRMDVKFHMDSDAGVGVPMRLLGGAGMWQDTPEAKWLYSTEQDLSAAADSAEQFNQELRRAIEAFGLTEDALAQLELERWYEDTIAEAERVGGDLVLVEQLYGLKRVQLAREQAQAIVEAAASARKSIAASMVSIRRQMPGWSETDYQSGQVKQLYTALDAASAPKEKIAIIEELQDAIMARYEAEIAQIEATQTAQETMYDQQNQALQQTQQIVKRIKDYLAGLVVSDISPLSPEQKLAEAKTQYEAALAKAQMGNAEAAGDVTELASRYLNEARKFYASTPEYAAIFDAVYQQLAGLENVTYQVEAGSGLGIGASGGTSVINLALSPAQEAALLELNKLDDLLKEMQKQAKAQQDAVTTAVKITTSPLKPTGSIGPRTGIPPWQSDTDWMSEAQRKALNAIRESSIEQYESTVLAAPDMDDALSDARKVSQVMTGWSKTRYANLQTEQAAAAAVAVNEDVGAWENPRAAMLATLAAHRAADGVTTQLDAWKTARTARLKIANDTEPAILGINTQLDAWKTLRTARLQLASDIAPNIAGITAQLGGWNQTRLTRLTISEESESGLNVMGITDQLANWNRTRFARLSVQEDSETGATIAEITDQLAAWDQERTAQLLVEGDSEALQNFSTLWAELGASTPALNLDTDAAVQSLVAVNAELANLTAIRSLNLDANESLQVIAGQLTALDQTANATLTLNTDSALSAIGGVNAELEALLQPHSLDLDAADSLQTIATQWGMLQQSGSITLGLNTDEAINAATGVTSLLNEMETPISVNLETEAAQQSLNDLVAYWQSLGLPPPDLNADPEAIPGYATGGIASPGLAVVGEQGPELIRFGAPAQVYSNSASQSLLRESPETVAELRALIKLQASANQQIIGQLGAVEARLAGIESKARLEAAA